ncbi:hypothetical protein [Clostridium sp. JS66]|uniref:hypothetical protein n=1 Tax=Clostridium sp. JS66 TaxID=3064705 RepID=UPI00298E30BD|nr:hypothetical protein [Clostridium sp. JS66]WPC40016.1 hypothetical protein Q6H37_19200 [Clostridium sp. JS66]
MHNLQSVNLFRLLITILLAAYIIYKQITLRPVKPKKYIIIPIIFLYLTLDSIANLNQDIIYKEITPIILLALTGIVSGIASGMVTKIFTGKDGLLYQKGGLPAAILLFIAIPIRHILRHSISSMPRCQVLNNAGISYLIMLSSQLISRSITMLLRCPEILSLYIQQRKKRKNH